VTALLRSDPIRLKNGTSSWNWHPFPPRMPKMTFIKNALKIFVKTIGNYLMKINLYGLCRTKLP
jgi:hypothetical protein